MRFCIVLAIIAFLISCGDISKDNTDCPKFGNSVYRQILDTLNFEDGIDSNYRNKLVKIEDVDTLYRYRNTDSWTKFDYICSIYKQKDTPQYEVQVLKRERNKNNYVISIKTLDIQDWFTIKKKFDDNRFWCYSQGSPGCIDCGYNHIICKVKNRKRLVSFNNIYDKSILKGLAMDILEIQDNNLFHPIVFCKAQKDSLKLEMYVEPYNLATLVDNHYFSWISKNDIKQKDGISVATIHKKDSSLIKDIELVMKFHNGRVIRTTEKEIIYQK